MFSWTSTNTSMSAKRLTTLLVSGRLRMPEMASANGRLLLPATSFMRVAPRLRFASRVSKGIGGDTPFARARSSKQPCAMQMGRRLGAASPWIPPVVSGLVYGLGRRQQLEDALHRGARGLVGDPSPGPVQRALGNIVLLRNGAELLALRILHDPFDLYGLFTITGCTHGDHTLHAKGGGRGPIGKRYAFGLQLTLDGCSKRPAAVARRSRHGRNQRDQAAVFGNAPGGLDRRGRQRRLLPGGRLAGGVALRHPHTHRWRLLVRNHGSLAGVGQPRDETPRSLGGDGLGHRRRYGGPGVRRGTCGSYLLAGETVHALAARVGNIEHVGNLGPLL